MKHLSTHGKGDISLDEVFVAACLRRGVLCETSRSHKIQVDGLNTRECQRKGMMILRGNYHELARSRTKTKVTCWFWKKERHLIKDI